jgi:penicillin-binding protein 1A
LAPWFSEYVRRELDNLMYAKMDYYRDGYTVHTTLDLKFQDAAEKYMRSGIERANREFKASSGNRLVRAENTYIPIIDALSLVFDMDMIRGSVGAQAEVRALNQYTKTINPTLDLLSLYFGVPELKGITTRGFEDLRTNTEQNVVEGALVLLENETGYIKAIVGGSKFDENNQFIRATQAKLQPGSSFKPLYYSAAVDSGLFTPATMIYDVPIVYHNENGTPYIPLNFRGEFKGSVLLWEALSNSMNVPSIKVLDTIGFDAAISRSAALLGIRDPAEIRTTFPRVYPLGLGIISVSPLQMARAFATFANQGREVTPIAIRSIEDRNGRVLMDLERDLRLEQRQKGGQMQLISEQNAYMMTTLLKKTVEQGTLGGQGSKFVFRDASNKRYVIAAAGKTGTTQNWADAWTVGFTPYYTSAMWFGFDKPGNSLGLSLTGATLAGPIWGDFMREVHSGLPARDFIRPDSGLVDVKVCAKSGQLLTPACNQGEVSLTFLDSNRPTDYCTVHSAAQNYSTVALEAMRTTASIASDDSFVRSLKMPTLNLDAIGIAPRTASARTGSTQTSAVSSTGSSTVDYFDEDFVMPSYNPLLD